MLSPIFYYLIYSLDSFTDAGPVPAVSTDLPFPEDYFTKTVASVQNTYCGAEYNYEGLVIGDQTLNKSIALPNGEQRTNIYTSESLGIIVAYQGTNISDFDSIIHDVELWHSTPDPALGISCDSFVFSGWQDQFQRSWDEVNSTLSALLQDHPNTTVQVVGHSQGAAIAQLGALAIRHEFGDIIDKVICYGPPRVGNPQYAEEFDNIFKGKYTGVTNGKDWVYSVPFQFLDYKHPSGMVWITPANSTNWEYFADSEDPRGPDNQIPTYITAESLGTQGVFFFGDHQGIYMHSSLGTILGPCPAKVGGY